MSVYSNRFAEQQHLERLRLQAFANRDAQEYHRCCDVLGIPPEDDLLYEQGQIGKTNVVLTESIYGIPKNRLKEVAQEIYNFTIGRGQKPEKLTAGDILFALNAQGIGSLELPSGRKKLTDISGEEATRIGLELLVTANLIQNHRRD